MSAVRFLHSVQFVTLCLLLLGAACSRDPASTDAARTVYAVQIGNANASAGETLPGASFAGDVRARKQAPLSFRVGGSLLRRNVDVGDAVRAAQVLAVLDSGDQSAQANAIRAQLAAAQAQLTRVRADQARYAKLAAQQLVSRSMMDAQNAAVAAAQGEVTALQANLKLAGNQARYTQLTAPSSGIIAERLAEAGQVVAAGQPIFNLAEDGAREVLFAVPESDIAQLRTGMPVQIEIWARPGERLNGTIRELSPMADPQSRTFTARATVSDSGSGLQLGQSAKVYVPGLEPRGTTTALSIPLTAVVKAANQPASVFVIDPSARVLKQTTVTLGEFGVETVPVVSGLRGGEWIVGAGVHLLRDGQKVAPVDRDNRPVLQIAKTP